MWKTVFDNLFLFHNKVKILQGNFSTKVKKQGFRTLVETDNITAIQPYYL